MYQPELDAALAAAHAARALLLADVNQRGGPRGSGDHAPADQEAEWLIRSALTSAFPGYGFLGEETGSQAPTSSELPVWVVDPNDGTRAMLSGYRGHAVSIALVANGLPVLGVVFAVNAPDDDGDLFTWAEGCGSVRRNGQPLAQPAWQASLGVEDVVQVSHSADESPIRFLGGVAPARFQPMPSIAYRLALVAAGDAVATTSIHATSSWDVAGGHALLRGAGAELFNAEGTPVRYDSTGKSQMSRIYGGGAAVCAKLREKVWDASPPTGYGEAASVLSPCLPQPGRLAHNVQRLRRAQGCLLGQVAGDSLGALVEFQGAAQIASDYPDGGPRELAAGGPHTIQAGQPTDDSELALMLARTLAAQQGFSQEASAQAYARWYQGWTRPDPGTPVQQWLRPFDVGGTTRKALCAVTPDASARGEAAAACVEAASRDSQANGALMRVSPLGVWGANHPTDQVAEAARQDARLTHPHPVCQDASAVFAVAIAAAIRDGLDANATYQYAHDWARGSNVQPAIVETLTLAANQPPADYMTQMGWVVIALQNAFFQLLHAPTLAEGVIATVRAGGDTDTNGAICGALLGAVHGRDGIPAQWQRMVLTCRPYPGAADVSQPRPAMFWPTDLLTLADLLLTSG